MTTATPRGTSRGTWVDGATWEAVRDHVPSLDAMVLSGTGGANLVIGDAAVYVHQHRVSAGFFRVLGVPLLHGREFAAAEDRPGGPALAVLSYDLWRRFFKSDPAIVGQAILVARRAVRRDRRGAAGFPQPAGRGCVDAASGVEQRRGWRHEFSSRRAAEAGRDMDASHDGAGRGAWRGVPSAEVSGRRRSIARREADAGRSDRADTTTHCPARLGGRRRADHRVRKSCRAAPRARRRTEP